MQRNGIDITKVDIRCCDDLYVENGYIDAEYELWFDIEKWLGISLDENSWVNLYTDWFAETGEITCTAIIVGDKGDVSMAIILDEEEKAFFRSLMEAYADELYDATLTELYALYEDDEPMVSSV